MNQLAAQGAITENVRRSLREGLLEAFQARFRLVKGRFVPVKSLAPPGPKGKRGFKGRPGSMPMAGWKEISRQIKVLHEAYTVGGGDFAHDENPIHAHQAGYQFYFLPRNFYRVLQVLEHLPWAEGTEASPGAEWGPVADGAPFSVLDLGCGTGAFSLAFLAWLAGREGGGGGRPRGSLRLVLVDQGHELMELAEANIRAFARRALPGVSLRVEIHPDGAERFLASGKEAGAFSLVGSAMVVNELNLLQSRRVKERAVRFITPLRRMVRGGGVLMLVEPGTRKGYMHLMAVRDVLEKETILYPCPHGGRCPLWDARVSRWCHATARVAPDFFFDPELRAQGKLRFAMRELNLCGLALQMGGDGGVAHPFRARAGTRVVSGLLPARAPEHQLPGGGGKVVLTCTAGGDLREIPAKDMGGQPRGRWLETPERPDLKPAGERGWKNKP